MLGNNSSDFSEMVDNFFKILGVMDVKLIPNSVLKYDAPETRFCNLRGIIQINISRRKYFFINEFSLGNTADEYYKPKKQFKTFKKPDKPIEPKDPALRYLQSRGIGEEVAKRYQITVQTDDPTKLVIPFFDEKGDMPFIKYRKTDFVKGRDTSKEWCQAGGKPILFGMDQCNLENKTLIMTEGQIDSISVAEVGYENAVSVPTGKNGFTWVPYCWDWLQNFDTLIVFLLTLQLSWYFHHHLPCHLHYLREY